MTFETCLIKKFWPAEDKGDEDEIIRQLVIQAEVALDNSRQVGELYNNMVRGLVRVSFLDSLTGEELVLPTATIKPFNIKQKKVRVGKGDDADVVKTEFAALNIVTRIPDDNEGRLLAELYPFFNIEIQMSMEQLDLFDAVPTTTEQETDLTAPVANHQAEDESSSQVVEAPESQMEVDDDDEDDDLYLDDDDDFEDEIQDENLDQDDENFINDFDDSDDRQ
jgi:hypothetical protein